MNRQELEEGFVIFDALSSAYAFMLNVPATDSLRIENQAVYVQVRDAIALATKKDPETIQNRFEEDLVLSKKDKY